MVAVQVAAVCVAAAMVCAAIRLQRPEMATALSLAVGVTALLAAAGPVTEIAEGIRSLGAFAEWERRESEAVIRAAGITVLSELGVQLCMDAGESALAGRIRLVTRIAVLGLAMPVLLSVAETLKGF